MLPEQVVAIDRNPMANTPYARPPVVEAVIELKTDAGGSHPDVERAFRKMAKAYPDFQILEEMEFSFDSSKAEPTAPATRSTGKRIFRRTTKDGLKVVQMTGELVTVSALAPYDGWDEMEARARGAWEAWRNEAGKRSLRRIGVRFINRIDIPAPGGEAVERDQFLRLGADRPPELTGVIRDYSAMIHFDVEQGPYSVIVNSAKAPSPLLDHLSIKLDIDLYLDTDLPRRDDGIWQTLKAMRSIKNDVFEACITDRARELFA